MKEGEGIREGRDRVERRRKEEGRKEGANMWFVVRHSFPLMSSVS